QLGIAVDLRELGHLSGSDLARHFNITPQSASTALNHLEKIGWVHRVPHPINKRVIWYEVTEEGTKQAKLGKKRLADMERALKESIGSDLFDNTKNSLFELVERIDGPEIPPGTLWPVR